MRAAIPSTVSCVKGRLQAEGIPAMLKGEGGGPYRFGPVYLWVRGQDEATARAVVDAVRSGAFEIPSEELQAVSTPVEDVPG